jgi:transposase InsO family protein
MTTQQKLVQKKLSLPELGEYLQNVSEACRIHGCSRQHFYDIKKAYESQGLDGLKEKTRRKPCHKNRVAPEIEEKIIYLRRKYHLGQLRISWFLERYHGIKVSPGGVRGVLQRNGLNRLPKNAKPRTVQTHRYEKQVPGHHIQVDVKFLKFEDKAGKKIRRFQYTAIDDATRIRALKIYNRHTQENAIKFVNYVIDKFPFRIHTVRTDNGHEFQAKFHWHLADLGIRHVYIKPQTPRLNGEVERSHGTDEVEFYQLLEYTDDVDLNEKLKQWEDYYNLHRPHSALKGKSPYEVLKEKMKNQKSMSIEV